MKKKYELGITAVGRAGVVRALLSILTAAAYPRLLKFLSPAKLMGWACFGYGVIMLAFAGTRSLFWGEFAVVAYAVPFTALLTIPVALTMENSTEDNRGKYVRFLYSFEFFSGG